MKGNKKRLCISAQAPLLTKKDVPNRNVFALICGYTLTRNPHFVNYFFIQYIIF